MNIILKGKIMPEPLHISSVFFYIFLQKRSIPFFFTKKYNVHQDRCKILSVDLLAKESC